MLQEDILNMKLRSIKRQYTTSKWYYIDLGTIGTPKTATKPSQNNLESEKNTYRRGTLVNNSNSNMYKACVSTLH